MIKTKKSLWAAGLALLISIALLIATTFAWFTDSVTNSGNKIQAGNLSIALIQKTDTMSEAQKTAATEASIDTSGAYTDISDIEVPIFNYDKWEPGYTDYKVIGVKNTGTLALKYKLDIVANGDAGELADVIDVYVKTSNTPINDTKPASFDKLTGYTKAGTLAELMADNDGAAYGNLYPSTATETPKEAYVAIALHMDEAAGNEYQGASVGTTFDVKLVATQLNSEKDGFGNPDYDKDAEYPVFYNASADTDLSDIVNNPNTPVEITATEDMLNQKNFDVTGNVTMNLGSNTINPNGSQIVGTNINVKDGGKLTINAEANSGFTYTAGKLVADGLNSILTVNGGSYANSGAGSSEITASNGGTVYLNEGRFSTSGYQGHAVIAEAESVIYINGGSFSSSGAQSIVIYANGGTIKIDNIDSITANGKRFGVANGGTILVSKEYSPSKPTSVAAGCKVTDNGDGYWLISQE